MDSFRKRLVVDLTDTQLEYLTRPIRGQGGYQLFLEHLQDQIDENRLVLTREDCRKLVRYATEYGPGGFQARLLTVIQAAQEFLDE